MTTDAYAIRAFAANLLRLLAGGGRPDELRQEASAFAEATGYDALWCAWERGTEDRKNRSREEVERQLAVDAVVTNALRFVAARLIGQKTQETTSERLLTQAARELVGLSPEVCQ